MKTSAPESRLEELKGRFNHQAHLDVKPWRSSGQIVIAWPNQRSG
jgi:hypothetical protein